MNGNRKRRGVASIQLAFPPSLRIMTSKLQAVAGSQPPATPTQDGAPILGAFCHPGQDHHYVSPGNGCADSLPPSVRVGQNPGAVRARSQKLLIRQISYPSITRTRSLSTA